MAKKRTKPATIALNPHERNPNSMTDADKAMLAKSLAEHGDLSGIVWNRANGKLVGGHQRIDVLRRLGSGSVPVAIDRELPKPTAQGTVGWGHIEFAGESYPVRVVEWPEPRHQAAMIAANRFGRIGVDDMATIKDLLQELDDGSLDMELTGYSAAAIEELMTQFHIPDSNKPIDEDGMKDTTNECPKCGFKW